MVHLEFGPSGLLMMFGISTMFFCVMGLKAINKNDGALLKKTQHMLGAIALFVAIIGALQLPVYVSLDLDLRSASEKLEDAEKAYYDEDYQTVLEIYSTMLDDPVVKTNLGYMYSRGLFDEDDKYDPYAYLKSNKKGKENMETATSYFDSAISDGYIRAVIYKIGMYTASHMVDETVNEIRLHQDEPLIADLINAMYKGLGAGQYDPDFLQMTDEQRKEFIENNVYYAKQTIETYSGPMVSYREEDSWRELQKIGFADGPGDTTTIYYVYKEGKRLYRWSYFPIDIIRQDD